MGFPGEDGADAAGPPPMRTRNVTAEDSVGVDPTANSANSSNSSGWPESAGGSPSLPGDCLPPRDDLGPDQARQLLRALADPIRLQVVETLARGERCVCDLTADLELAQSKLSFHLRVLKEAGLIASRQQGRWMHYRLRPEALGALSAWMAALTAHCHRIGPGCR